MRPLAVWGTILALAAALAACDSSNSQCFDSGGASYGFSLPGDTSLTFSWPASYHPVRFYAEPVAHTVENVDAGLQLWANAFHCNELTMQRVSDSTIADVIVRNPAQLPPLASGSAMFADSVGACRGRTDIALDSVGQLERPIRTYVAPFNADTTAVNACYHFVTAHEIGHALGLFTHSTDPADLMYGVPRKRVLSTNDRFTIQTLYRQVQPSIPPVPR